MMRRLGTSLVSGYGCRKGAAWLRIALAWIQVAMEQPLPVYLLGLIASLRDKPHKGFPVKKVGSIFAKACRVWS